MQVAGVVQTYRIDFLFRLVLCATFMILLNCSMLQFLLILHVYLTQSLVYEMLKSAMSNVVG